MELAAAVLFILLIVVVGAGLWMLFRSDDSKSEGCVDAKGRVHPVGASYLHSDGCNTCVCGPDGDSACTLMACAPKRGCVDLHGVVHRPGESYLSPDGCNRCVCGENGLGACTRKACPSPR